MKHPFSIIIIQLLTRLFLEDVANRYLTFQLKCTLPNGVAIPLWLLYVLLKLRSS